MPKFDLPENEFIRQMLSRQQPIFGDEGSKRLRESVVAVAGIGGVGSLTLELLARAGISRFRLLDTDEYHISNMNRQIFATVENIGRPKVEVAVERLKLINPYVKIEKAFHERINLKNLEELLDGAHVGIVGADSPSSGILFKQVARRKKIRLIYAFTTRWRCGAYVDAYDDIDTGSFKRFGRGILQALGRIRGGRRDLSEISEEEALKMDIGFFDRKEFTPTMSFATNCASCLAAALTIKYLSGADKRPHSVGFDFARVEVIKPKNPLLELLSGIFRRRP